MDLNSFLQNLGLSDVESAILKTLIDEGEHSVFDLGKKTGIIRTTIYRAIEDLANKGLVIDVPNEYRKTVKAASFEHIKQLVDEKRSQVDALFSTLPELQTQLETKMENSSDTKVYFYRGSSGIRQLQWNILTQDKECRAFFSEQYIKIIDLVGRKYEKKWMEQFKMKRLSYRGITTPQYMKTVKRKDVELDKLYNENLSIKVLPPKVLTITNEMRIYGDTTAFYNLDAKDITGIEIVNKGLALMLSQMFDMYWKMAK